MKLLNIFYFQSISGTCLHLLCAFDFHLDKAHKSVNNALWFIRSFGGYGAIFTWLLIFRFCNKDIFPETADFTQMLTCRQIINPFFILRVSFSVQLAIFPLCGDTLGLNIWKKMEQIVLLQYFPSPCREHVSPFATLNNLELNFSLHQIAN